MDGSTISCFGVASLLIVLGFIALLKQKQYLNTETGQTEVEVPFFGKLKTNYPALVFVLFGSALSFYAFDKSFPPPMEIWTLRGGFSDPLNRPVKWSYGTLELSPTDRSPATPVAENGHFEFQVQVKKGHALETDFQGLHYYTPEGTVDIDLGKEYNAYRQKKADSLLADVLPTERQFKTIPIAVTTPAP